MFESQCPQSALLNRFITGNLKRISDNCFENFLRLSGQPVSEFAVTGNGWKQLIPKFPNQFNILFPNVHFKAFMVRTKIIVPRCALSYQNSKLSFYLNLHGIKHCKETFD